MFRELHLLFASAILSLITLATSVQAQSMMGPGYEWAWMGPGIIDMRSFGYMCSPTSVGFPEWVMVRVERLIKPNDAQRAKFDEYKIAVTKAAAEIRGACPASLPATVVARMEIMEKHTEALSRAIKTVRPVLAAFYETLTEDQKSRFDSISGPDRLSRSPRLH